MAREEGGMAREEGGMAREEAGMAREEAGMAREEAGVAREEGEGGNGKGPVELRKKVMKLALSPGNKGREREGEGVRAKERAHRNIFGGQLIPACRLNTCGEP